MYTRADLQQDCHAKLYRLIAKLHSRQAYDRCTLLLYTGLLIGSLVKDRRKLLY